MKTLATAALSGLLLLGSFPTASAALPDVSTQLNDIIAGFAGESDRSAAQRLSEGTWSLQNAPHTEIEFSDNAYYGYDGCNGTRGTAWFVDGFLIFEWSAASTLMACMPDRVAEENEFKDFTDKGALSLKRLEDGSVEATRPTTNQSWILVKK